MYIIDEYAVYKCNFHRKQLLFEIKMFLVANRQSCQPLLVDNIIKDTVDLCVQVFLI